MTRLLKSITGNDLYIWLIEEKVYRCSGYIVNIGRYHYPNEKVQEGQLIDAWAINSFKECPDPPQDVLAKLAKLRFTKGI